MNRLKEKFTAVKKAIEKYKKIIGIRNLNK